MTTRARGWVIAAIMCLIAGVAVTVAVPSVLAARRNGAPRPDAPGLAALSDHQLAELLPATDSFPAGWTPNKTYDSPGIFGYSAYHNIGAADGYQPVECYEVAYGGEVGGFPAATVDEHDQTDPAYLSKRSDIRISIAREFNPTVFDYTRALASRCPHFHARFPGFDFTIRILEDSRPADGPQRFRYSVTVSYGRNPVHSLGTSNFAYERASGLIVSGMASDGHQHLLDRFFADTLHKLAVAER